MKKWLVALLGIFMICGAGVLSACTNDNAYLVLSKDIVDVKIHSDEVGSGEAIITADVFGASNFSIEASANGYEEYITVSTEEVSSTRTNIIIKGEKENDSPSVVTVRVAPGNIEAYIYVNVYSEIESISQNFDANVAKENFLVKGMTTNLNVDNILKIEPAKANKDITWSLDGTYAGATIHGNQITISETFSYDEIKLKATASNGVTTQEPIVLKVLDKIDQTIGLKWSYSQNSSFELINEEYNDFVIVPNVPSDEKYQGYVAVDYSGDLEINGYATTADGQITDTIVVNRFNEYNGMPLFKISTKQGKINLNGEFKVAFKIGYANYNYSFDTMSVCPISISAREKVNNITVSTNNATDIEGSLQTLYTNYADSTTATSFGNEYHVSITPTTVIDASNKYAIVVTRTQAGGQISTDCPVEISYKDSTDGNKWKSIRMISQGADYVAENPPSVTTLYIKASNTLTQQSVEGVRIIFQSIDNPVISTYFDLKLVKSVSLEDFTFENGDFRIDSSANEGDITQKKQFTLQGQTTTDGLYIINNSEAVTFGDVQFIANGENSVTFEVALSLKASSYGITTLDTYQIAHRNGLVSEKMYIDIFLPLKDASVKPDAGNNQSNSVTYDEYSANTYFTTGEQTSSTAIGLSYLMLKNDTTTPLIYSYNSINEHYVEATISVGFMDFVETEEFSLEDFKALANNSDEIANIIATAKTNGNSSNIAYFTNDSSSIITKGVGYTYAVIFFTGKGVANVDDQGNITLARIVLVESYVSPNSINVHPQSDKNVTLYSVDSLSSSDSELTRKAINIRFANTDVTYTDITNIEFVSKNELMGRQSITGNTVTWQNGRYSLSNVVITGDGISFNIEVVGTFGELAFYDTLDVHYVLRNDNYEKVYDIFEPIDITIKNAQRVESLKWKNSDEDLYFEVGEVSPKYIMLETQPTNARNDRIAYVVTDSEGGVINTFLSISDEISSNVLAVNLSALINKGMTGFIYLLPADAVFNNQIRYYYLDENGDEREGNISDTMLGQYKDSALKITYYDFLTNEAYFKSNASDNDSVKNISFADILIKINVTVADGKSFAHSYRIFDAQGFKTMKSDLYYTVMNSIDLTGEEFKSYTSFSGGIQGANNDVTIKLDGDGFAGELAEGAIVRNLAFNGQVNGDGFVATTNNGLIENVTVDVNGISPSSLVVKGYYGGGIAGTNFGQIKSSSVLGLNISGTTSTVGGLVGRNFGLISNGRVEFYNLAVAGQNDTYSVNQFKGTNVGAFVGVVEKGSRIERTFAYNYSQSQQDVLVASTYAGAFAGSISQASTSADTTIDYSFAFVGVYTPYGGYTQEGGINLTNFYIAYLDDNDNYSINYVAGYESNPNFVFSGQEGFENYVNEGKAHLRDLMQDERVDNVDYSIATTVDANGYYKSIATSENKGIMFAYKVNSGANDLTSSEINDLAKLNTISLAQLVGQENVNKNIIITSSDSGVVKVVGSSLQVLKTGDITLTLSSKQDVEINKTIQVAVRYSMNNMQIAWTSKSGNINYVKDNSTLTLQKTRSRDFVVSYDNASVYLGTTANEYQLEQNKISLNLSYQPADATAVTIEKTSETSFKITANDNSVETSIVVSPVIFTDPIYQNAINAIFQRNFKLQPIDGVISFGVSGEKLPITPSLNTVVRVEIKSTDENDSVVPMISFDGENLAISNEEDCKFEYMLPRDNQDGRAILNAIVEVVSKTEKDGVYTFTYDITFSIAEEYKADISENMDFEVYFESISGNSSKEWNGTFTLALTRQNFTSIDVQTRKINDSQFKASANGYVEVHNAGEITPVLAPGNSAIMQININPSFAYFDHVDFTYSFNGQTILEAVNVEIVEPFAGSEDSFVRRKVDGSITTLGSSLRYTPTAQEKARGAIYYKLWLNTSLEKDSRVKFTATFCETNGKVISYVNSYITVSYLTQPTITVDGADTAYLAKGDSAQIKIDVLADQTVDTLTLDGNNVKGINISSLSEPILDEGKGIKTYYATVSSSVLADTDDDGMFYVQAQVSRELNGSKEYKVSTATIVLVDFKLDSNDIEITGTHDDNLVVWQNVPKSFNVEYSLIPDSYMLAGDQESQSAIEKLMSARESFLKNEYYPSTAEANDARYLINYKYNKETKLPEVQTLENRLFYVIGNEYRSVFDSSVESPLSFSYDKAENKMMVTGSKVSEKIQLVLLTYISAGGVTATYEKHFTITVETYSDPDLPLTIADASDFEALNPTGLTNVKPNDYILTNDIVLENYTPFSTNAIRSLDGNGYTIYIKSFNTAPENTSTLKLALFDNVISHTIEGETVPTTLKNVRVNLYNGGQITVNTDKYKTINIAGLAIENNGVITNCEVVSFYTNGSAMGKVLAESACILHSNPSGINVTYVAGINTTEEVFHDGNSDWSSEISGFVLTNYGSITNSRVGGDTVKMVGSDKLINGQVRGYTYASEQTLDTFHIVGQGNMAGFVLANSGYIASSFAKNIDMENQSNTTSFYIAGFVGANTSSILASYVEGVESDEAILGEDYSAYAREGSSIRSEMGYIAGFIYSNAGNIKDSYSNILIENSKEAKKVYLASGFVFENEGTLENCYSASQILNSNFTQMNFSGVNAEGELLKSGTYTNCYFFNKAYETMDEVNDTTTESRYDTGALLIPKPDQSSYFYGFAIADGESDGIWALDEEKGLTLIEANNISISHRYVYYIEEFEGVTGEDEQGKYILPYATLIFVNSSVEIDTSLGGKHNPILVEDANDWLNVTGLSQSSYISEYFNSTSIWGNYRLVNNIDLSLIASSDSSVKLPSSEKSFAGALYGNGFQISGISMTSDETDVAFGLFASIEKHGNSSPIVTNVTLKVEQVIAGDTAMVGSLAGYIKEANIINVSLVFNENSMVTGLNFAGSLAGLAFGDNVIKNVVVENPSVVADRYSTETINDYFTTATLKSFRTNLKNNLNFNTTTQSQFFKSIQDYSYAGGLIGFIDNYGFELTEYDFTQKDNYSINNLRINGIVKLQGQVVGGAFGLTSYQTNIRDVGLAVEGNMTANSSYILSTKYFAGGLIGQSFGSVSRVFAVHEKETQDQIEDNMSAFYGGNSGVERGILNLFYSAKTNYTQKYVGGLIGYAGSGNLEVSYSKLNVTSPTAEYAGGIVGGMELEETGSYQAESDLAFSATFTKYFLNEVYATGDVRANNFAGGIIGAIKGRGSRVAMLAVNAFNYFTTYDYVNLAHTGLGEGQTNVSNNFKVNSLVGAFIYADGDVYKEDIISSDEEEMTQYQSYLSIMLAFEEQQSSDGVTTNSAVPSVAVYENYDFGGVQVTMNLFTTQANLGVSNPSLEYLFESQTIYVITGPSEYTNSETGHTYTQEGFLNSGSWNQANWAHLQQELFPEIRYKRSVDVLYLDCYNVQEVFNKMTNGGVRVIVRGLVSPGSEEYADVNIDNYLRDYVNGYQVGDPYPSIVNYSGRFEGGIYTTTASNNREEVKIIASQNFITSTGVGFYADGLTVEYRKSKASDVISLSGLSEDITSGLFIKSEVVESTLNNVTIIINNPVVADIKTGVSKNIGIVAPVILSTSINNLAIKTNNISGQTSILTVAGREEEIETVEESEDKTQLNVGILAGIVAQDSTISIMQINGVTIDTSANLIALSNAHFDEVNLGGYFGKVERESNTQEIRINIGQLIKKNVNSENKDFAEIMLTNLMGTPNVYVGGYFGQASGVAYLGTQDGKEINSGIAFMLTGRANIQDLYVGGVMGLSNTSSALTIVGQNSIMESKILMTDTVSTNNLYSGGFAGVVGGGKVTLSNFNTINLSMARYTNGQYISPLNQNSFAGNYIQSEGLNIVNDAYIGIAVGAAWSQFEMRGNNQSTTQLNGNGEAIKLNVGADANINFGSVVGFTNYERTVRENEDSSITSVNTLALANRISSKAQVVVEQQSVGDGKIVLGGLVGNIVGNSNEGTLADVRIGSETSVLGFDGAFYTNAREVLVGGVIGSFETQKDISKLSVMGSSFGGAVKVYGQNSNLSDFIFGGTVGKINANTNTKVEVKNNFNYGDVFVEYDSDLKEIANTGYTFGGLIGYLTSAKYDIVGNYTLTSSHNARQSSVNNKLVNALYGNGIPDNTAGFNYYNHAVTLTTDYYGVSAGYNSVYAHSNQGYNGQHNSVDFVNIVNEIYKALGNPELPKGHKLNPIVYGTDGSLDKSKGVELFNGVTYYSLEGSELSNASLFLDDGRNKIYSLNNVALIGNGNTIDYTIESGNESGQQSNAFVRELLGHSYISGIVLNANIVIEQGESEKSYAPLVGVMKNNSIVYAVNVRGSIELGSKTEGQTPALAGLVGQMNGGKIFDCSTDIDLIYRAGENGEIYAITNATSTSTKTYANKLIENTYSAGSLKTLINAKIFAFAKGASDAVINDCYTISKVDFDNYTTAVVTAEEDSVQIVNSLPTTSNLYYDVDGLNYAWGDSLPEGVKKYSQFRETTVDGEGNSTNIAKTFGDYNNLWIVDYNFNYGYPTLRYNYLKTSSYATREVVVDEDATGYDAEIVNSNYTRLENGRIPTSTVIEYFYLVPNVGVLSNMANIAGQTTGEGDNAYIEIKGNFALLYDIEFANRTNKSEGFESFAFVGKFDGRDKTINNMSEHLFVSVGSSLTTTNNTFVRNLRLTNSNINGNFASGLLSETITNATVSNMTLSGFITKTSGTNFGGLANSASGAIIDTITNLTDITVTTNSAANVGGIVGALLNGSAIKYSSNYGPITVVTSGLQAEDATVRETNVGGIAGSSNSSNISYSYNATSVLNNYATSSAMASTLGKFSAGGIVGADANSTIANSYNSGMIKAGNKANTMEAGGSYAGGIVGFGKSTIVDTTYNEGKIEALGLNPTFAWTWENNEQSGNVLALVLRQNSERNVFASGIGYFDGGSVVDSHVKISTETDETSVSINNNGGYAENGAFVHCWPWSTIETQLTADYESADPWKTGRSTKTMLIPVPIPWPPYVIPYLEYDFCYQKFSFKLDCLTPELDDVPNVKVTQVNSLEIPTAFALETYLNFNFTETFGSWISIGLPISAVAGAVSWKTPTTENAIIEENFTTEYPEAGEEYYALGIQNKENKINDGDASIENTTIGINNDPRNIVRNTRSAQDDNQQKTVAINSKNYYIADKNNINSIFNAGVYEYRGTYTSSIIPYFANSDYYKISATLDGEEVSAKITSIEKGVNSTIVNYIVYRTSPLDGELSVNVKVDYSEIITFNTGSLKYIYTDDYSIGISGLSPTATLIKSGYKLSSKANSDIVYTQFIKISNVEFEEGVDPKDNDANLTYLAYDETKGIYVYIPNARLEDSENNLYYNVNNIGFTNLNSGSGFEANVNTIIQLLAGKTFYSRATSEDYIFAEIAYTASGKNSIDFVAGKTVTNSQTLSYGKEVTLNSSIDYNETIEVTDNWYEVSLGLPNVNLTGSIDETEIISYNSSLGTWEKTIDMVDIEGVSMNVTIEDNKFVFRSDSLAESETTKLAIENYFNSITFKQSDDTEFTFDNISSQYNQTTEVADRYYEVSIVGPGENIIGLDGETALISYKHSTNAWGKVSTLTNLNLGGYAMNLTVENNKFVFRSDAFTAEDETVKTAITNFFNSLKFIANKSISYTFEDNFADVVSGDKSVELGDAGSFKISTTVSKDWTYSNAYGLQINEGNGLTVTVPTNNPDLSIYSLNGVAINYGQLTFSASQSYTTSVINYALTNNTSSEVYYTIELFKNSTRLDFIEFYAGNGMHVNSQLSSAWKDMTGNIRVVASIYGSYAMTKDDLDEFKIALEDADGKQFFIEGQIKDDIATVMSVSQFVKTTNNKNVMVKQQKSTVTEDVVVDGETVSQTFTNINYYVNNVHFLTVTYKNNEISASSIVSVTLLIKENGESYSQTIETDDGNGGTITTTIEGYTIKDETELNTWKSSGKAYFNVVNSDGKATVYSISSRNIVNMTPFTRFESAVTFNTRDNINYLLLNADFNDINTITYEFNGEDFIYNTSIKRAIYEWNEFTMPVYSVISKTPSYDSSIWDMIEINNGNIPKYLIADKANRKITLILNAPERTSRYAVTLNLKEEFKDGGIKNVNVHATETLVPLSIILQADISFNDIGTGFTKSGESNIIGNGYYISYYGSSLYNTLDGNATEGNSFIRDVSFVGETYNSSLFVGNDVKYTDLFNINLYGSVTNLQDKIALIADASTQEYATITTFKSFASIDSQSALVLLDANIYEGKNYGIITVPDGQDGIKGADGENVASGGDIAVRNGKAGTAGTNGMGIKVSNIEETILTNNGIIYSGNGGNGGAGGTSYRGDDRIMNYDNNRFAGSAGEGGNAGNAGEIVGFDDGVSISKAGFKGADGVRSRHGIGYLGTAYYDNAYSHTVFVWAYYLNENATESRKDLINAGFTVSYYHASTIQSYLVMNIWQELPKDVWETNASEG